MKIWTGSFILCGHDNDAPPLDFLPQFTRGKRVIPFVGADFAKIQPTGNSIRAWSFGALHEFDTVEDAEDWVINLDETVPEQADVTVELEDRVTQKTLPDCFIEFTVRGLAGSVVRVDWLLTFGAVS